MSEPYLGQIEAFGFSYPPRGWALCQGQMLSIQQNTALFALLGTYYGGNGVSTFQLPDLRGRVAVSQGTAPSGTTYIIGETMGTENVGLLYNNMPLHTHAMNIVNNGTVGGQSVPSGSLQLGSGSEATSPVTAALLYAASSGPQVALEGLGPTGGNVPHPNMMPYLAINYCISLSGLFPSRG
jgi:microcystin-dependent protein